MNIRLDQITADDVGNQRQKKKSKISKNIRIIRFSKIDQNSKQFGESGNF